MANFFVAQPGPNRTLSEAGISLAVQVESGGRESNPRGYYQVENASDLPIHTKKPADRFEFTPNLYAFGKLPTTIHHFTPLNPESFMEPNPRRDRHTWAIARKNIVVKKI
jgi:hypothetical protein